MLIHGTHSSFEEPPNASMFALNRRRSSVQDNTVSGMVTAMNNLCQVLLPKEAPDKKETLSSPMKRAQLRGTYMKQLNELRQLYDSEILNKDEYEEQRLDLVKLLRKLKE